MSDPLRVAVIARAVRGVHGVGGLEQSVYDLVRHLAARQVDVTLITPPPAGGQAAPGSPFAPSRVTLRHVPYVTWPFANRRGTTILDRSTAYPLFGWRAGRAALALARAGAIDIVHAFGASGLGYAQGRRQDDPPLVVNPQGLEEFGGSAAAFPFLKRLAYAPLRAAVRATTRPAARIIATDRALEPVLARHLRPRADQVVTIPNGIDLHDTAALAGPDDGRRIRLEHGLDPETFVLLSVGRLEHNKGFDVLARALGQAARPGGALGPSGWRWVLAGDGPYRADIEALIHAEGLDRHTLLAGRVSDRVLHAWYEAASLFVHPTRYEGSSLVTLEAMAHGRAIVATRAGGLPDKVRPGVNGWLAEAGSAESLGAAIADAAGARAALEAMGRASREIVEQEFSWSVLAARQIALYNTLLGRA